METMETQPSIFGSPYGNQYQQPYIDSYHGYVPPTLHPHMQQQTMFMPHQTQPIPQVFEVLTML